MVKNLRNLEELNGLVFDDIDNEQLTRANLELSKQELEFLNQLPVLKVPIIEHQPPLTYLESGVPKGYLNQLLDKVADVLNIKIERTKGLSFSEAKSALHNGTVDLSNDYSFYDKPPEKALLTDTVLRSPFVAVGRSDAEKITTVNDFGNHTVVLVKGFQQSKIIQAKYPKVKYLIVNNIDEAYKALRFGKADFYIDNATHAAYFLQKSLIYDLKIAGFMPEDEIGELRLYFAINTKYPMLQSIFNKAIKAVESLPSTEKRQFFYFHSDSV